MKITSPQLYGYRPLLRFVNEPLTPDDWRRRLHEVEIWQCEFDLGLEAGSEPKKPPLICGSEGTHEKAQQLQRSLRKKLDQLTRLCSDRQRLARESESLPDRGAKRGWTWRKAQVLPTRELFFDDAGEALNFLVEGLEYEIKQRDRTLRDTPKRRRLLEINVPNVRLNLGMCSCGCRQFFLWEGIWEHKQRKFLDDSHRMDFHNRKNVKAKRDFARKCRSEGRRGYF